ncbi:Haloacid dehalogenase domain protein hydrolase [Micromonospora sp. L5]|uniref:HAD family hydrolase n=1 Tax=Micromonospora TaxID=1873 RepID=UPI0001C45854|nr:HAD family hydrolase [Micromonospora sp. L5]ADU06382.1 Haloacid dehalogenase domain protein hydrolase [Micromonospora sp. L5]
MTDIRAVLLDFGGTLFAMPPGYGPYLRAAESAGESMTEDQAADLARRFQQTMSDPTVIAMEEVRDRSPQAHRTALITRYRMAGMSEKLADALYAQLVAEATWEVFSDTASTLRTMHAAGLRLAVVSNIGWDLRRHFVRANIHDLIDAYVLSCELGIEKPQQLMFTTAAQALGVQAEQCLMVGDDPYSDGAAIRFGMPTLLLPPHPGGDRGLGLVLRCLGLAAGADTTDRLRDAVEA